MLNSVFTEEQTKVFITSFEEEEKKSNGKNVLCVQNDLEPWPP